MTTEQFSLEPRAYPLCMAGASCSSPAGVPCRELCEFLAEKVRDDPAATASLLAFNESAALVEKARPDLEEGLRQLTGAETETRRRLWELSDFVARGIIGAAVAAEQVVEDRHVSDGPFDRRRRPRWHTWLPTVVVIAAGVFDSWFFGVLFSYLGNTSSHGWKHYVQYWIGYLPGVILAVVLYVVGQEFGKPLAIWRRRFGWSGATPPRPAWRVVVPFALFLLGVVGLVAWTRGDLLSRLARASESDDAAYVAPAVPSWVIVVLLIAVSVGAIFVKAVCVNPDADSADTASARVARARDEYQRLRSSAQDALDRHVVAWQDLRGAVWRTHSQVNDLWARATAVYEELAVPPAGAGRRPGLPDGEHVDGLLAAVPGVPPAFGVLLHVGHAHGAHSPASYLQELDHLVGEADRQWAPGRPAGPADHPTVLE